MRCTSEWAVTCRKKLYESAAALCVVDERSRVYYPFARPRLRRRRGARSGRRREAELRVFGVSTARPVESASSNRLPTISRRLKLVRGVSAAERAPLLYARSARRRDVASRGSNRVESRIALRCSRIPVAGRLDLGECRSGRNPGPWYVVF